MALTRIKTDQITDLAVTNAKIDNLTIEGGKLANNLTYGSNFTISGNLTVNGATTTVDTTNTVASDPLIVLNRNATGANANDIGLVMERGSSTNVAFIYKESTDEFVLISTSEVGTTTGTINITSYQPLKIARLDADNLRISGNEISSQNTNGNIILNPNGTGLIRIEADTINEGNLRVDGNVTLGNATGDGHTINGNVQITNGLNISGGNNTFAGNLSVDGNVTLGNNASDGHTINGIITQTGQFNIDNIRIDNNTISSTNSNGNINLDTNGTGATVISSDTYITGNLYVTGTETIFNVIASSTEDPVFHLGGPVDASILTSNDGMDRGIEFHWYDSADRHGFFGLDNSTGEFTFIPYATEPSLNIYSGSEGTARFGNVKVTSLTPTRVVYVGASDQLVDSANLVFSGSVLTLTGNLVVDGQSTVDNIRINGNTISSINTNGDISITPNGTGVVIMDNVNIDGNNITSSGSELTVNTAQADKNFRVATDNNANTFFIDGGNDNIGILTATPNAESALHINGTNSMIIPTGSQGQRPNTGVAGMLRFNTTSGGVEAYDGVDWVSLSINFTIITSQTFTGDGSTVAFTLNETSTTASSLVAINGVLQVPTVAYGITGTTLTFTEAPESGDVIEVRKVTTLASVVNLSDTQGYTTVETERTASDYKVRFKAGQLDVAEFDNNSSLSSGATFDLLNGTKTTYSQTAVTVGTSLTAIDTFAKATYRTAKYVVQVANSGGTVFESSEVLVVHNGTTATMIEYGVVSTSGSSLGTLSTAINGANVELRYTGASSGNNVKVYATYITV
jgi:hypothetical protein